MKEIIIIVLMVGIMGLVKSLVKGFELVGNAIDRNTVAIEKCEKIK